jgi:hypothetical protein
MAFSGSLQPRKDTAAGQHNQEGGATIPIGARAPIIGGAFPSSVFVPFIEMMLPYEDLEK